MLSIDTATRRTVVTLARDSTIAGSPVWSPDGTSLAYVVSNASPEDTAREQIWIVSLAGGEPRRVADALAGNPRLRLQAWKAGGNTIFATGLPRPDRTWEYEHWVLEGFLPQARQSPRD